MRRSAFYAAILVLVTVLAWGSTGRPPHRGASRRPAPIALSNGTEDDPNGRDEMEFLMLRDPRTNAIPWNIRQRFVRSVPTRDELNLANQRAGGPMLAALSLTQRGPNNRATTSASGARARATKARVSSPSRHRRLCGNCTEHRAAQAR